MSGRLVNHKNLNGVVMDRVSNEVASTASTLPQVLTGEVRRESTVNDVLLRYPATVGVFNAFGIDACCGGEASIADAAQRDGANVDQLMNALVAAAAASRDVDSGAR